MANAKKETKNTSVAKPALTALVLCDCGKDHKLSGLFVALKLKAPTGDSKEAKLARILEGSPDPGTAPLEPKPLGSEKKDKAAAAKYKERKKQYDDALAAHQDTPTDPTDKFALGIVDDNGFLQPVHDSSNPWFDVATKRDPDTYKIAIGEKYDVCLLRHPSPTLARALVRHLNRAEESGDEKLGINSWGDELTHEITVDKVSNNGADQAVIRAKAKTYVPPGPEAYGGWTLYRDMPNGQCEGVDKQVATLCEDIGKLFFPVGTEDAPFKPKTTKVLDRALGAKGKDKKPPTVSLTDFDGQVQAAVARLQEVASAGKACKLLFKDKAQGGNARAGLIANPVPYQWDVTKETWTLGVVDDTTADLVADWVKQGLRKPDEILIPTSDSSVWLLARGAVSLDLWSELVTTCGFDKGVKPGSSMRSILVGSWPGAIMNSVHKTGLAVDLAGGGNRFTSARWPVRYEAHWKRDDRDLNDPKEAMQKADAKAKLQQDLASETNPKAKQSIQRRLDKMNSVPTQADAKANWQKVKADADKDAADGKWSWTQRWRLYGQSSFDLFNHAKRDDEVANLKAALTKYANGVKDKLKSLYFKGLEGPEVTAWIEARSKDAIDFATSLAEMDDDALIAAYFRDQVVQFHVNAYEGDGGSAGKVYKPSDGDGDFPPGPGKSWVNISALGYPLGMERIGPHSTAIRDQAWVLGPDNPKSAGLPWPMASFFVVPDDEDKDLVLMLHDITRSKKEAPQLKEGDRGIPVQRGPVKEAQTVATYKPDEIDGDFVKAWRDEARKWPAGFLPSAKRDAEGDPRGAQVKLVLGVTADAKSALKKVTSALSGSFGANEFFIVYAGNKTAVDRGVILKGSALGAKIDDALEAFAKKATLNKPDAPPPPPAPPAADGKPKKPIVTKEDKKKKAKADAEAAAALLLEWTLVIQPVFPKKGDAAKMTFMPEDSVVLPPGSNANHLEWWHYQHRTAGPTWGDLLEECGYSLAVMGTPRAGNLEAGGSPVHRGLGYQKSDISGKVGSINAGPVENRDEFTPPGG